MGDTFANDATKTLTGVGEGTAKFPSLPDLTLLREIGRGAYGEVWLARTVTGHLRAVKIIHPQPEDAKAVQREFDGVKTCQDIARASPGLLEILHVGRMPDGGFYYVMPAADDFGSKPGRDNSDYVPHTLRAEIKAGKRISPARVQHIGVRLAAALSALHKHNMLHRDIKPANIVVIGGEPFLADIGLVRRMEEDMTMAGTAGYMPPEGTGTKASDIYSLGMVLYEMLTGNTPADFPALHVSTAKQTLEDQAYIRRINDVILRACAQLPKKRFASADELGFALEKTAPKAPAKSSSPGLGKIIAIVSVIVIALIGLFAWSPWNKKSDAGILPAATNVKSGQDARATSVAPAAGGTPDVKPVTPAPTSREPLQAAVTRSARYPQDVKWIDVTEEFRRKVAAEGHGDWDGEWLTQSKAGFSWAVADGRVFTNAAVRVTYFNGLVIFLRRDTHRRYTLAVGGGRTITEYFDASVNAKDSLKRIVSFPVGAFDVDAVHELTFAAQGSNLTAWLDGIERTTTNDTSLAAGKIGVDEYPFETGRPSRIKKVEYAELPDSTSAYPQPPTWIDGTEYLRQTYVEHEKCLAADHEWLRATTNCTLSVSGNASFRNPIVRVFFVGSADICVRRNRTSDSDLRYEAAIHQGVSIHRFGPAGVETDLVPPRMLDSSYRAWDEHEAVFAVQGDKLTVWLDGRQMATARDNSLTSGGIALTMSKDDNRRIKKVEYAELPDAAPAETLEPGAIRLWVEEDKNYKADGVRWENGNLVLGDGTHTGWLSWSWPTSRDAIIRAEVQMVPGSYPRIGLRHCEDTITKDRDYRVGVNPGSKHVDLAFVSHGIGQRLQDWPLPRAYGTGEWMRVELRAVGDELTVSAEGKILGTVHHTSQPQAGSVFIYAEKNGHFRNIVYVPLDKPGTPVSP